MADQTTDFLNFLNDQLNTRVASNEAIFQPTSDGFLPLPMDCRPRYTIGS